MGVPSEFAQVIQSKRSCEKLLAPALMFIHKPIFTVTDVNFLSLHFTLFWVKLLWLINLFFPDKVWYVYYCLFPKP